MATEGGKKIFSLTVFVTVVLALFAYAFAAPMISGWFASTPETKA